MAKIHVVRQGEYLSKIASRYGFKWQTLYDHPNNIELKRKRPDPNILCPGDEVFIPTIVPKTFACETGKSHRLVLDLGREDELSLVLSQGGDLVAAEECNVSFLGTNGAALGQQPLKQLTTNEGQLKVPIARGAMFATIEVAGKPWLTWTVAIGHLDPVRDHEAQFDAGQVKVTGIQARLNNLGFTSGPVDGRLGPITEAAIREFQRRVMKRVTPDGKLDEETCDRITAEHGC